MLRLEMLPAACGDCLWIEYGEPSSLRVVIIDGGVKATARTLLRRIEVACSQRNAGTLEVELLIVTHIDNDHIQGIIELLKNPGVPVRIKDIWFNGRDQLNGLVPLASEFDATRAAATTPDAADEFLGSPRRSDRNGARTAERRVFLDDFLGPAQGDELSAVLESKRLPWNRHAPFCGGPIIVPVEGTLPVVTLDGGMTLTLLGPVPARLHKLKTLWDRVRRGDEDHRSAAPSADYLRRGDEWPPVWRDGETSDSSATNGSSIMLLAAFEGHEVLLSGDAHASDIAEALERVRIERSLATPLLLDAFKLAHHGSANNVTRAVLDQMDCGCFMVSTDGSTHGHPDNQALLRILRYSTRPPVLIFNYTSERTHRWGAKSVDVMRNFPLYTCQFPEENALGARLDLG